jgi:hypothetical protein
MPGKVDFLRTSNELPESEHGENQKKNPALEQKPG